jgi:hypothetical protein
MRTCPAASKVSTVNPTDLQAESYFGYTHNAWQIDVAQAGWMADNVCFGDGTVRHVRAEDLWTLRWNRESGRRDVGDALGWLKHW